MGTLGLVILVLAILVILAIVVGKVDALRGVVALMVLAAFWLLLVRTA